MIITYKHLILLRKLIMKTILAYLVLLTSIEARPGRAHNNDHEALGVALKYIPDDVAHHYNF